MKDYIEMSMHNFLVLCNIAITYLDQRFPKGLEKEDADGILVRIVDVDQSDDGKYSLMISLD